MIISSCVCVRLCFCRVGYWLIPCPYLSLTLNGGGSCEFVNGTFHKSPRVQTLCFQGQIVFHEKLIEWSVHHWANVSHYLHSEKNSIEVSLLMAFAGFGSSSTNCEIFQQWQQCCLLTLLVDYFIAVKVIAHWSKQVHHSLLEVNSQKDCGPFLKWCHGGM